LLTSIVIPEGVTIIYNYTFNTCESLTSISIPKSVTEIRYSVFYGCPLEYVYYCENDDLWNSIYIYEDGGNDSLSILCA
jgi:hypothetical protein